MLDNLEYLSFGIGSPIRSTETFRFVLNVVAAAITSVYDDVGIGASAMAAVSIVFDGVIIAGSGVSDRLLCKSVRLLSNDATNVADGDKGLIGRCVAAVDTPRITAPTELGGEHGVGKMSATAAAAAAVAAVIAVVAVVAGVAVVLSLRTVEFASLCEQGP
ncbi:hypothetical protein BASA60_001057 [Batrachochytrium salamandrivorans]|nr:hypothetical protein BASA60_001057 [Batrachochytrium salamandrivorans]